MFRRFCVSRSAHRLSERLAACSRAMPKPSYSRSQKVGNPIASILKSNVYGIPTLFGLNPVSNFMGFTVIVVHLSMRPSSVRGHRGPPTNNV